TKVFEREGIDGLEVGPAVTAAQGNRFDLFAASWARLGVSPSRARGCLIGGLFDLGRVFTSLRRASTNLGPATRVMRLIAGWACNTRLARAHNRLADRAARPLAARIRQGRCDDPLRARCQKLSLASRAADRSRDRRLGQLDARAARARNDCRHR